MAHFYANIQGSRGEATRCGTKSSGMDAHARGWELGGRVECHYDDLTGADVVTLSVTGGSNARMTAKVLAEARIDEDASEPTITLYAAQPLARALKTLRDAIEAQPLARRHPFWRALINGADAALDAVPTHDGACPHPLGVGCDECAPAGLEGGAA